MLRIVSSKCAQWLWPVVLAAGSGRRLAALTGATPKQFWRPDGHPSLLEETLARLGRMVKVDRITAVVDRTHVSFLPAAPGRWSVGQLLFQPEDRGTGSGVLFGLTPVLESDPDGIVMITPSDHGIASPDMFCRLVRQVTAVIRSGRASTVVFGAAPTSLGLDYGWIVPGPRIAGLDGMPVHEVVEFFEKPSPAEARRLLLDQGLWSTMIVLARARVLADMYEQHLPGLAELFAEYRSRPEATRRDYLIERYAELEPSDFSRHVLTPARNLAVWAWPAAVGWSDLGTPDRLSQWTAGVYPNGRKPAQRHWGSALLPAHQNAQAAG